MKNEEKFKTNEKKIKDIFKKTIYPIMCQQK